MFSEFLWRVVINIKVNNSSLETGCSLAGHSIFNPLNAKLNSICHLLALGAHPIFHVSRIRFKDVNLLVTIVTLRILHSNIQGIDKIMETVVKDINFFIILVRTERICVT
jgi:hypothetical protein